MARKKKSTKKSSSSSQSNNDGRFDPSHLDWTIIARPLLTKLEDAADDGQFDVIINLNFKYEGGLSEAKQQTIDLINEVASDLKLGKSARRVDTAKKELSQQYLFASLEKRLIVELAKRSFYDEQGEPLDFIRRPVFMIWPDFEVRALAMKSISTVKADAAHRAFAAGGDGMVWAVLDSGIDGDHKHFEKHNNLSVEDLDPPLHHRDFTDAPQELREEDQELRQELEDLHRKERKFRIDEQKHIEDLKKVTAQIKEIEAGIRDLERRGALTDELGHGTHVAGIIAGMRVANDLKENNEQDGLRAGEDVQGEKDNKERKLLLACTRRRDEHGERKYKTFEFDQISGMAPRCKLLSIKVLDENGEGRVSNLLAAIAEIQQINEHGRWLKIHGVNLSVGYDFEPEWFACGQSPLCVEVDRLVKSGVVVVAAAGNTGYGYQETASARGVVASGMMMSINDPGNADLAITVGSTHREMPHMYGVSFFSSKGPTGDGRLKPDLVAPGERIVSCAAGKKQEEAVRELEGEVEPEYAEDSGTSMAAPHVSGAIAAFLSIRREFIGKPERVKEIFVSSATDLKRERYLQGNGLVDLMRAIQSL